MGTSNAVLLAYLIGYVFGYGTLYFYNKYIAKRNRKIITDTFNVTQSDGHVMFENGKFTLDFKVDDLNNVLNTLKDQTEKEIDS